MWIAFKNYYLRDEEQRYSVLKNITDSCELLSKIIIFVTRNNSGFILSITRPVVNCFQKLLSSWRGTTLPSSVIWKRKLWIAFKNYYLRDEEQLFLSMKQISLGCELLSKIIIFVTRNNISKTLVEVKHVVNCFQKLLSSWRGTTAYL